MPTAPRGRCTTQQCRALSTKGSHCDEHQPKAWARRGAIHPGWTGGSTRRWRKTRLAKLKRDPICQTCRRALATTVDHITPLAEGGNMWADANHQSLCKPCHDAKSDAERRAGSSAPPH